MEKNSNGPCDFMYLRTARKGQFCGEKGWRDGPSNFRCKKHRLFHIRHWIKKSSNPALRKRFDSLEEEVKRLREQLKTIMDIARSGNKEEQVVAK